ncbi:MAG: type II toxin-antitoxin system HicB family antitoxin [Microcystis novacekii Mn_MB_F_20050700_S1D]|uniref:Type II toxin-antitoxin system HicB family antitoxin n=1 Tax=Microcystis novacekii Mn_MB_F_20050700_S1D TaxID=2486266 RepID=A0A552J001_9CHRO|nr:MAG: type II toxin-antitoxin system HicB family antitoxin [Microcystis novacekii Mn_MB_F_20050700_S1D]
MKIRYELIIYWSNEEQLFIVEVPELAGCMADGETYQEAVQNAEIILCDNFCLWNLEMLTGQDF